ncbi:transglycosylase domain-containing protein [Porcincola sp. LCP21S3_C12]|uniref:transglycosylase domain-containing protein n=1 Tax=Porcincola sp. LCP21S3_C12 TaxID=3438798 RepID=UPI003F9E2782
MRTGERKKRHGEEAFPVDFDDRIMPGDDLLPDDFVPEETPEETEKGVSRRRTRHQEAAVRDISKSLMEDETISEESSNWSGEHGKNGRQGRRGRRPRSRALTLIGNIFKFILIVLLVLIIGAGIFAFFQVRTILKKAPEISPAQFIPSEAATYIYDADGKREQKLTLPEANRDLVSIKDIPKDLQHAVVAIEDERFYKHNGVDPKGIARALVKGLTSGHFSEGASTITQQLLKNSVFPNWMKETTFRQRLERKIQEQFLALKLEKMLTKEQILEDYLNTINLGAGCYGVQSAAYRYFGVPVSELSLSESTVIAGITQNPTAYNPITNPEKNKKRRTEVLDAMLRQGYITQSQYASALADDVYARIQDNESKVDTTSTIYTFYQDALIDQVMQDLEEQKGYTHQQAYKAVYSGGLRIYSAQDDDMQKICDEEFENPANFPSGTEVGIDYALSVEDKNGQITDYGNEDLRAFVRKTDPSFDLMYGTAQEAKDGAAAFRASVVKDGDTVLGERVTVTPQPQASCVIIDSATGLVKALVGGRGTKEASLTLNRASYTQRQPGSTFKILAVYAPALDEAGKTLATVYKDEPYNYEDGTPVKDAEGTYAGDVTIRQAIVRSINVAAVKCLTEITPQAGFDYAEKFGITSLVESKTTDSGTFSDVGQTLALGGLTYGVTNLEMTGAYAAIANGGQYLKPHFYTQVLDTYGNVVLDNTDPEPRTVVKDSTAALLTSAMRGVISDPEGTAYGKIDLGQMAAAGKTGTTTDYRDSWFVGFTPYVTCGIWAGYDNNAPLPDKDTYHTYSKTLWNSIMNRISQSQTISAFGMPSDVVSMSICSDSHMAAAPGCPNPYTEYFAKGTEPKNYCNIHGDGSPVDQSQQQTDGISPDAITIYKSDQATVHTQTPDAAGGAPGSGGAGGDAAAGSGDAQGAAGGGGTGENAPAAGFGGSQGTAGTSSGGSGNPAAGTGSAGGAAGPAGGSGSSAAGAGAAPSGTGSQAGTVQQGGSTAAGGSPSAAGNTQGGSAPGGVIQIGGNQAGSGGQQGSSDKDVIEILNNIPPAQ